MGLYKVNRYEIEIKFLVYPNLLIFGILSVGMFPWSLTSHRSELNKGPRWWRVVRR